MWRKIYEIQSLYVFRKSRRMQTYCRVCQNSLWLLGLIGKYVVYLTPRLIHHEPSVMLLGYFQHAIFPDVDFQRQNQFYFSTYQKQNSPKFAFICANIYTEKYKFLLFRGRSENMRARTMILRSLLQRKFNQQFIFERFLSFFRQHFTFGGNHLQ